MTSHSQRSLFCSRILQFCSKKGGPRIPHVACGEWLGVETPGRVSQLSCILFDRIELFGEFLDLRCDGLLKAH